MDRSELIWAIVRGVTESINYILLFYIIISFTKLKKYFEIISTKNCVRRIIFLVLYCTLLLILSFVSIFRFPDDNALLYRNWCCVLICSVFFSISMFVYINKVLSIRKADIQNLENTQVDASQIEDGTATKLEKFD